MESGIAARLRLQPLFDRIGQCSFVVADAPLINFLAKIGKQMNLRRSQLERLLLLLGENESWRCTQVTSR
jgi:hypothetical protein